MNKRQCIGLWHAKGYKLEAVEAAVQRRGFSRTSLSDMGQSTEPADPEFVALAWKAKVLGTQEDFEIYWRGLASLGVEVPHELLAKLENPPPRMDPQEVAPKLGTSSSVVEKLETALSAVTRKLDSIAASLRGKLDIFALEAEGKLDDASTKLDSAHEKLDSAHEKLDAVQATLNGTGAKIGVIDTKLDGNRRELRRLSALGAVAMFAAVSSCIASVSQRLTAPAAAEASVPAPSTAGEAASLQWNTPADPERFLAEHSLDSKAQHLGEKVAQEHWVPKEPLPNQKRAPCDPTLYEVTVNGGCWVGPRGAKPPCGRLYRSGNECYLPVAADPSTPVGEAPQPSIQ